MAPFGDQAYGDLEWGGASAPVRLRLLIGGADYTANCLVGTIQIEDELNARNTARFQLYSQDVAFDIALGAPVSITYGDELIFAGSVDRRERVNPPRAPQARIFFSVECVDYNQLCDRELVVAIYQGQTLKQIVADIHADKLLDDGVTLDPTMEDGPTFDYIAFNYRSITDCLNELADLSGYAWTIDYQKVLHVFSQAKNAAPWALDSGEHYRDLTVRSTREQYRNSQYVRAGRDVTDPQTEHFAGDGKTRTWTTGLPIAEVPTITVNGAAKTVGIRQVETGKNFYWQKDSTEVTQDAGGTLLLATDDLAVTAKFFFPIIVNALDAAEITARAAVEGGSGLYEAIEEKTEIDRSALALDYALGWLRKNGRLPTTIEVHTDRSGLAAGQAWPVILPEHSLSQDLLIARVTWEDVPGFPFRWSVEAIDGEYVGGWREFFRKLAQRGPISPRRENEVLMYLRNFDEALDAGEAFSAVSAAATCAEVGTALVGFAEVC